ncbi:hypothetical protein EVAR_33791_1 [Eumeta japonica]|uniref:Uncharacterized protein n=1 Tax=Eumeta variegata TaxID=151549 RepID=A0A4C1VVW4_EUMVA|nr:hypothetical protein EVAR_33791_1 [Eumeta japonica]
MPLKQQAIGRSTHQARKKEALRASESDEQRALKLENLRVHAAEISSSESSEQREVSALKFKNETPGMCCASGNVKLPELHPPPEALLTLLSGVTRESKHFLENIRKYNSCFQIISFGVTNIVHSCNIQSPKVPIVATHPNDPDRCAIRIQTFTISGAAFAKPINKAQRQSLQVCGLNLENPCFSHGQLYVACSHFGKSSDLFVYEPDRKKEILCIPQHFNK